MITLFCLRLAWGMAAVLLLLTPAQVNPRFYRVQFLVVLGLVAAAALFLPEPAEVSVLTWLALGSGLALAFVGSMLWSLHGAPAGQTVVVLTPVALGVGLLLCAWRDFSASEPVTVVLTEISSAAVLGGATTTMLMGHSYLIAPSMSIQPLLRLLAALFTALLLRGALAGFSLWTWSDTHELTGLTEVTLLLSVRWLLGVLMPLGLSLMAWQAARIRSTQSATGILYAVVFSCFVGELTGQLLRVTTHLPL